MSKKTAEMNHVLVVIEGYGALAARPRTKGKEVTHTYQINGHTFSYAHGTSRGGKPKGEFERDLRRAHRMNCLQRGINPSF